MTTQNTTNFDRFFLVSLFVHFSWLYFSRIKLSNLLLVAVGGDPGPSLDAEAKKINYTWTDDHMFPCHKKHLNELESRRLDDCFTEHCRVSEPR